MNITIELLKKYIKGECSEVEKAAVEFWLEDVGDEASALSAAELTGIKSEMWREIDSVFAERQAKTLFLKRDIFPYAAAACLLIGASALGVFLVSGGRYSHPFKTESGAGGMLVNVMPASHVHMSGIHCGRTNEIKICGNAEFTNDTGGDEQVEITSDCAAIPSAAKKVSLKKGRKYLAFHHKYGSDELYVIDEGSIYDLPPSLMQKVKKTFEI